MSLVRLVARPMLSSIFLVSGASALREPAGLAKRAKPVIDRLRPALAPATDALPIELEDTTLVRVNGAVQVAAGSMLAVGKAPRLAALVLAGSLVPTTFGGHRYWEESEPSARRQQRTHLIKNLSILGGLLLAAVDTGGRPSLAWRARRQAGRARKRAQELAP